MVSQRRDLFVNTIVSSGLFSVYKRAKVLHRFFGFKGIEAPHTSIIGQGAYFEYNDLELGYGSGMSVNCTFCGEGIKIGRYVM